MNRACAAAGVWLALSTSISGCSPALDWREVRIAEAGTELLFPCRPVRQQRKLTLDGQPRSMVLHVCDAGPASWALSHVDVADPAAVGAALQSMAASVRANLDATAAAAVAARAVPGATPQPQSGRWRLNGRARDGRALEAEFVVFAQGTIVVQATVLGTVVPPQDAETFLGSLRVIR